MSFNPATDFLGLWRTVAGAVSKLEMPGLDWMVSALGRSGLITVSVSDIAPSSNQAITAWFQPATPSYGAEGGLQLWNGSAYVNATPVLFLEMLAAAEKAAGHTAVITALLDTLGTARGDIILRGASAWQVLGPGSPGKVLTSNGAGADPSYEAVPAPTDVISLNGLTGALSIDAGTGISSVTAGGSAVTVNASAKHLPGTATGDNASVGELGEYIHSEIDGASSVSLAGSGIPTDVTSIALTAGDWDVSGVVAFNGFTTSANTIDQASAGISTTSGFFVTTGLTGFTTLRTHESSNGSFLNDAYALNISPTRLSLSAPTTVYLIGALEGSGGLSASAYGQIRARRMR